ncbi:hypothetical protein ILUMI_11990 [Ignelater luminosus]|uniref:ABC transporter domain-containing protein n=1 Tax=Ignelater luminosus TaxID=2038154 RepID=A0A8K0D0F8_IGNLU|nr:hypothetical protein ILUMI_11990 [Ignelater luminosus]
MSKCGEKFLLLMWKNFLLQWRHPVQTVVEILVPLAFASLLVVFRSLAYHTDYAAKVYTPFSVDYDNTSTLYFNLAWSPFNPVLETVIDDMVKQLESVNQTNRINVTNLKDSKSLEAYLVSLVNKENTTWGYNNIIAGIQFDDSLEGANEFPSFLNVTIRFPAEISASPYYISSTTWMTETLFPIFQTNGPRDEYSSHGGYPGYFQYGFLTIQKLLSYSIINTLKKQVHKQDFNYSSVPMLMQRFPNARYTDDGIIFIFQFLIPTFIMLSFLYTCVSTVKVITIEKERQLKETMKIMGLPGWLHWTAWFIKTFILLLISVALMTVFMTAKWYSGTDLAVFTHSNPFIIFLLFLCFACATITYCFAISVFFTKANTASIVSGVIWFLTFSPFSNLQTVYDSLGLAEKLIMCVFSNSAMGYGFQLVMMFEGIGNGAQWENIWEPAKSGDELVLGHIFIMLIVDTVLYFLIAVYVEAIFPGEYGVPQVWYFPFTRSYWCGNSMQVGYEEDSEENTGSKFYEKEPTHLKIGVKIKNLRKEFSKKNVAVKNLSLNLYEDQITVLLGHNGAGKTTTMSMLTGMIPPTGGTAVVGGHDIHTDIAGVRDSLGLCPQHNILFDDLTVREHLYFYNRLKGLNKEETQKEIDRFLELLELTDKGNANSSTLSGGMKRKLSVAIALCGNSKVVMCDEPSSGMDPSARRALWDLLIAQKKGRTILLTTHFMDEADLLGDRIAIMHGGELQCCGSSYYLKKVYGAGYRLIMDKKPECQIIEVTNLLRRHIPDIKVESCIGSELTYTLDEEKSAIFQNMLYDLEINSERLGILSYGVSITSFDEVFMKVSSNENDNHMQKEENPNQSDYNQNEKNAETKLNIHDHIYDFLTGSSLWFNQDSYNDPITTLNRSVNNRYAEEYINDLTSQSKKLLNWQQKNYIEQILAEMKEDLSTVRMRYIAGASFQEDNNTIIAFFNAEPYHSRPLSLQMAINSVLKKEVSKEHTLQFTHHPLPFSSRSKLQKLESAASNEFIITMNLSFALSLVSAFYVMFYIRERINNVKHLQFVSGVRVTAFWLSSYICDILTFSFTSLCIIITFLIFQEENFSTAEELGRIFSILFYFGFSMLPMVYLFSFLFQVPSSGFTKLTFINLLFGVMTFILIHFFKSALEYYNVYFIHTIMLVVPLYSFCTGMRDVNVVQSIRQYCDMEVQTCLNLGNTTIEQCDKSVCDEYKHCCDIPGYYDMTEPGIGKNVLISCLVGIILFLIVLAIDGRLFDKICYKVIPTKGSFDHEDDIDVAKEKAKIRDIAQHGEIGQYDLVMCDMTKYYKKLLAVNNICLGVNRQECFGLLGINGAGKTTTFKMMTGDIKPSSGDAWINGFNLKSDMREVNKQIGYCPQFDALLDDLTCWETLQIFGLLRGITLKESKILAKKLAKDFDFYEHLYKKVKQLSGGNKRKLSTAVALIGDPLVIYLDEPTTGMDPATKRYLWNALCKIRDNGKCIILTSHSMEECEALCTRLAIMVNGNFKCIGSTQHLKSRFSEGYTLIIRIKKPEDPNESSYATIKSIENFVKENFKNAVIREDYRELLTFYIADRSQPWSKMFEIMERAKTMFDIEDYSLGQSSLEQVFLSFTKYQQL